LKCPVCEGKLDFDLRVKSATCHTCGWKKIFIKQIQKQKNTLQLRLGERSYFINTKKS